MNEGQPGEPEITLDDFRKQLDEALRLGMSDMAWRFLGLQPDIPEIAKRGLERIRRMIDAMSPAERRDPTRIDVKRRLLIALRSDTQPHEVQQFLRQFDHVRDLMRRLGKMSRWERIQLACGFRTLGQSATDDLEE
jgi:signal recognition particle subunit SRP54